MVESSVTVLSIFYVCKTPCFSILLNTSYGKNPLVRYRTLSFESVIPAPPEMLRTLQTILLMEEILHRLIWYPIIYAGFHRCQVVMFRISEPSTT